VAELGRQGHDRGELDRPTDLAVDDLGLLCVVDIGNNRIQVFSRSGPSRYRRRDACDDGTCAAPAPQAARDEVEKLARPLGLPLARVGVIREAAGLAVLDAQGMPLPLERGFDHFAA